MSTLPMQAARSLMNEAGTLLDAKYGDGYSHQHPEQVSALMLTAALTMHARKHEELMGYLVTSLARMAD